MTHSIETIVISCLKNTCTAEEFIENIKQYDPDYKDKIIEYEPIYKTRADSKGVIDENQENLDKTLRYVYEGVQRLDKKEPICRVMVVKSPFDIDKHNIGSWWSWDWKNLQPDYVTPEESYEWSDAYSYVVCSKDIDVEDIDMYETISSNFLGKNTESEFIIKDGACFTLYSLFDYNEFDRDDWGFIDKDKSVHETPIEHPSNLVNDYNVCNGNEHYRRV